ncbi:hypothetical protein LUZ63_004903 [Rhynchospora breviuscula]|uniref:AAA+ ATPase domain-containing protein n=1 Tax=Rhynchospora breviuscula TaxID=2022672 RepID=A0A9Q0CM27_9POAL|nr:hypothetical protein LUZ63_004903 [Rhynchospora breviuscula]
MMASIKPPNSSSLVTRSHSHSSKVSSLVNRRNSYFLFTRRNNPSRKIEFVSRSSTSGSGDAQLSKSESNNASLAKEEGDAEAMRAFQKIKEAERQRVDKLEKIERKVDLQLERNLLMASEWSRVLMKLQGKLKGTEWDPENSHTINYSEFLRLLDSNNVKFMEYSHYGETVSVILPYFKDKEGKEIIYRRHMVNKMPVDGWNDVWKKLHQQLVHIDVYHVNPVPVEVYSSIATFVIWSIRLALAIAFYFWVENLTWPIYSKLVPTDLGKPADQTELNKLRLRFMRQREGKDSDSLGSLGKSRAKFISASETTGVTFDDFAGQEYIKKELQEIVKILKNQEEYQDKGIVCPKGVLLHGPPGTGKTLLAKAIAGEAGLPFFAANGTDFVEMFMGVAASRVKDLFSTARSFAPSIIFIDEIDAIGSKRGGPDIGGGGAEREQGLLQILNEMDGFKESTSQVLVIGATNRLDILDPALIRKGRFDKVIRVGRPSRVGRLAILKVHAKNKFFRSEEEKQVLLEEIAVLAVDFTGAELQNILNEAGILTARKDQDFITREELLESLNRQRGTFKTGQEDSSDVPQDLKIRLAYRESAIAVLACFYPESNRSFLETDIFSVSSKPNIKYAKTSAEAFLKKSDYINAIVRACAPRVIEEEMFGLENVTWVSAKSSIEALDCAERLILQTGMTALGKAFYRKYSDVVPNLAEKLGVLCAAYLAFAKEKCKAILREYRPAVEMITEVLLEKGAIKAEQIWEIYKKAPRIPQQAVNEVDEYGALKYAGRWGIHGISLPGRVTFAPGNVGFATFGAPRPLETQIISDQAWKLIDGIKEKRMEEIKEVELQRTEEKEEKKPLLLMSQYLL